MVRDILLHNVSYGFVRYYVANIEGFYFVKISYKKLWERLADLKISKLELQRRAGISSVSIAKLTKNENITTDILLKICTALQTNLCDIVETEEDQSSDIKFSMVNDSNAGLRLATVFSGIGAIEHALERLRLPHEIVFACDNGDIDILSHEVAATIPDMERELTKLQVTVENWQRRSDITREVTTLASDFSKCQVLFETLKKQLIFSNADMFRNKTLRILASVCNDENVAAARKKEYTKFRTKLDQHENVVAQNLTILQVFLDILNDFAKDNPVSVFTESLFTDKNSFSSRDKINWFACWEDLKEAYTIFETITGKKIIKKANDVADRLSMLHERIYTSEITEKLDSMKSYQDKKTYIDSLYAKYSSQNKVKESYMANYPITDEHFHWNVSFLDGKQYADQVDVFVGGSPCQSFSLVGKQRGLEDTRGTLFYEYARLVSEIRPKVFIYENVKAVLSNDEGRTWDTMQNVFTSLGYTWSYQVLNAKDYGIPQNRERVFVVGFRNDLQLAKPFEFPQPIPLEKTMQDFLLDNVSGQYYLPTKGVDFVTSEKNLEKRYTQIDGDIQLCQKKNQQFNWHGDFVFVEEAKAKADLMQDLEKYFLSEKVRKYVLASGTKGFYSRPQTDLPIARPLLTTMHKMHRAGVDNYVTTDGRLRKLTPRECLRLMGFCDSFKIVVSDTAMYQQSGNAIVVDVLMSIVKKILESYPSLAKGE